MRRLALIALLAVAASACTIDIRLGISLTERGSGSLTVDIDVDEEFHRLFRLTGGEFEDLIARRGADIGLGFEVTPGAVTRYSAQTNVLAADTLEGILEGLAPGIGNIEITATQTELEFDGPLNPLTSLDDVAIYFEEVDPSQFADDVSVQVDIEVPGTVSTSTGTPTGPSTLTWTIPFSDADTRLLVRSTLVEESSGLPWTWVIIGLTVVFAFGFLIAIRSRFTAEEEAATAPPSIPEADTTAPEDQPVALDETPPEDQPIGPEAPVSD